VVALCRTRALRMGACGERPRRALATDGAAETEPRGQFLKGGGGAHVREKLVARASARRIIVVEEAKLVPHLGATRGVPIEVVAFGWRGTLERIAAVLPGATHREGPPTDNGGIVVDAPLPAGANLEEIDRALKGIAGVG